MPVRDIRIELAGAGDVDDLRGLFLAMHRHHRDIVRLPLVADDAAWDARRAQYLAWLAEGRATLFVARGSREPAGYALVVIHDGTDDTFPLAPRYAELYSLSVAPRHARAWNRGQTPGCRRRGAPGEGRPAARAQRHVGQHRCAAPVFAARAGARRDRDVPLSDVGCPAKLPAPDCPRTCGSSWQCERRASGLGARRLRRLRERRALVLGRCIDRVSVGPGKARGPRA